MEMSEFKARKEQLEDELTLVIAGVIRKFEDETGFCPRSVSVDMVRHQALGERNPKYDVAKVRVDIEI